LLASREKDRALRGKIDRAASRGGGAPDAPREIADSSFYFAGNQFCGPGRRFW
jgi:hypothetical protein